MDCTLFGAQSDVLYRSLYGCDFHIGANLFLDRKTVKLRHKKAWNRPVAHSTHRGSCTAYYSRTDNVRAHADMKIMSVKRPI